MLSKEIMSLLNKYEQSHLLNFYNILNENEKENLENQINKIDFSFMNTLYKNSFNDEIIDLSKISALKCITYLTQDEKKSYIKIGEKLIKNNEYAIVIMAGGNGSRLGHDGPKGCLELDIKENKISLFEVFINQLKKIKEIYNVFINLYIMTSNNNNSKTIDYFESHLYFNYPKDNIHFFTQDELPILDVDGKILLKNKSNILFGPNGNGNVFMALKNSKMIDDMERNKIKYILFSTVDNILTNLVDLSFIGATIQGDYKLASKTLFKENADEKDWIFCKYNNRPFMLPSTYISNELSNKTDSTNNYIYRGKNVTYHLISIDSVKNFSNINLKYHRAFKKCEHIDSDGNLIKPNTSNSFKFEQFIFDAFYFEDDMLLYKTKDNEFCPIKTKDDIEKASKALSQKFK